MKYRAEPIPDRPFEFRLVDKETGEPFHIGKRIAEDFDAGKCAGKLKK